MSRANNGQNQRLQSQPPATAAQTMEQLTKQMRRVQQLQAQQMYRTSSQDMHGATTAALKKTDVLPGY